jgi:hypothetical protein
VVGEGGDLARLLRGLSVAPSAAVRQDASYLDTVLAVDQVYAALKAAGWDGLIKPWSTSGCPTRDPLPLPDCVGQVGHPLRRLRADRLQGHAARVHALEQADPGAEQHG